jgi:hypothetical protein
MASKWDFRLACAQVKWSLVITVDDKAVMMAIIEAKLWRNRHLWDRFSWLVDSHPLYKTYLCNFDPVIDDIRSLSQHIGVQDAHLDPRSQLFMHRTE